MPCVQSQRISPHHLLLTPSSARAQLVHVFSTQNDSLHRASITKENSFLNPHTEGTIQVGFFNFIKDVFLNVYDNGTPIVK